MSKFNFKVIPAFIKKNAPTIMIGTGIAGMVASTIIAVKVTPKAVKLLEERKIAEGRWVLTKKEVLEETWKLYLPSAVFMVLSAGSIILGTSEFSKREAALTAAYALTETTLKEYSAKVIETIGEAKEEEIRGKVEEDKIKAETLTEISIFDTGKGTTLCKDSLSGRFFYSDINIIKKEINEFNRKLNLDEYLSLNDLYYELGLDPIVLGDRIGWNMMGGHVDVVISAIMTAKDEPCCTLSHRNLPEYNYDIFM